MFDRIGELVSRLAAGHSLAGHGMEERIRSATFALLGVMAAIALGFVAVLSNQGWSVSSLGPIQTAPPGPQAIADAASLFSGGSDSGGGESTTSAGGSATFAASQGVSAESDGGPLAGSGLGTSRAVSGGQAQVPPSSPGGNGAPPSSEPGSGPSSPGAQPGPVASNPPASGAPSASGGSGKATAGTPGEEHPSEGGAQGKGGSGGEPAPQPEEAPPVVVEPAPVEETATESSEEEDHGWGRGWGRGHGRH